MTLSTTTSIVNYTANGTQTVFAVPFPFRAESHLRVSTLDTANPPVETVKTLGTDYAVGGEGSDSGGTVAFTVAPTNGHTVRIKRLVPLTQLASLRTQGPFAPKTIEDALDLLTQIAQQLNDGTLLSNNDYAFGGANANTALVTATGGVTARQLNNRFAELAFNVKDFGATGDGTTNDKAAIDLAKVALEAAGRGTLYFPPGTYNLGSYSADTLIFHFNTKNDIRVIGDRAKLILQTTGGNFRPRVFTFTNCNRIEVAGLHFSDSGTDLTVDWKGAVAIRLVGTGSTNTCGGVRIHDCEADTLVSFLECGDDQDFRVRDISVYNIVARSCYYGVNCQNNGDGLRVRDFRAVDCRRPYFPYGITDHDVEMSIYHAGSGPGSNGPIKLSRLGNRNTKNIRVRATFFGSASQYTTAVSMEHQDTVSSTGLIEDIDIDLTINQDIASPNSMIPIQLRVLDASLVEVTTTTNNRWNRIAIRGNLGPGAHANPGSIQIGCTQNTEGVLSLDPTITRQTAVSRPHFKGFVVRTSHDKEFRTLEGVLNTLTSVIPLAWCDGAPFTIKLCVYAIANASQLSAQETTYEERVVVGYNAGGGAVVIQDNNQICKFTRTSDATLTLTASGENINVTFGGANYNNANGFAKIEVQYVSRGPKYGG